MADNLTRPDVGRRPSTSIHQHPSAPMEIVNDGNEARAGCKLRMVKAKRLRPAVVDTGVPQTGGLRVA